MLWFFLSRSLHLCWNTQELMVVWTLCWVSMWLYSTSSISCHSSTTCRYRIVDLDGKKSSFRVSSLVVLQWFTSLLASFFHSVFSCSISNSKRFRTREPCLWDVRLNRWESGVQGVTSVKWFLPGFIQPFFFPPQTRPIGSSPSMMHPPRHLDPSLLKPAPQLKSYHDGYLSQNTPDLQKDTLGSFSNFPFGMLTTEL